MAGGKHPNPSTTNTRSIGPHHPTVARNVALAILAIMVLTGIIVLIPWHVFRPTKLVFSIDEASIRNYNLANSTLNSTFDFAFRVSNPSHVLSVYHESMQVSVSYQGQVMATRVINGFFQGHNNVTRIKPEIVAQNVGLGGFRERAFRRERTGGAVKLTVGVNGRVRFRVGRWKSGNYKLTVQCSPVVVYSDFKRFHSTTCDVDV